MSDDRPKSAYEIALEKLKERDRERGEAAPAALSEDQKKRIADVRRVHEAKIAERDILYRSERDKLASDPEAAEKLRTLEENYRKDRRRIDDQRERDIETVRSGGAPGPGGKTAGGRKKR